MLPPGWTARRTASPGFDAGCVMLKPLGRDAQCCEDPLGRTFALDLAECRWLERRIERMRALPHPFSGIHPDEKWVQVRRGRYLIQGYPRQLFRQAKMSASQLKCSRSQEEATRRFRDAERLLWGGKTFRLRRLFQRAQRLLNG